MRYIKYILILIVLISGCAYYNTFFNAKKYFTQAQDRDLLEGNRPSPQAVQDYNRVIQRCTIVINEYPNSKYVDDALLLMGRSLYYKQTHYKQALERFNELIQHFPDSPLVPEALLYISKTYYAMNRRPEAFSTIREFLVKDEYRKFHPKAHYIIAEYYMDEENYILADDHLETIINRFPRSEVYEDAFMTRGEMLHEQEKYEESKQVFTSLIKARIPRESKLDARYYIAYNDFLLENYQPALEVIEELEKDENRNARIPHVRLLQARILSALGNYQEAEDLFNSIIVANRRTRISAEAYYRLAEMYFLGTHQYDEAIEHYGKVSSESSRSEYVEKAVTRSSIVSQIIQYHQPATDLEPEELVQQHFKLAEYYIEALAMPDSALAVYDNIIDQKDRFTQMLDSMQVELDILNALSEPDSTALETISSLESSISNFQNSIEKFESFFIPQSIFSKIWVYSKILSQSETADSLYQELKSQYPDNKFTHAAHSLLKGETVEFITESYKADRKDYEQAIGMVSANIDEAINKLEQIANNEQHHYREKAMYSLGYLYHFTLSDSETAKTYLDNLLNLETGYTEYINKFYDGTTFLSIDTLPSLMKPDTEEKEVEGKELIEDKQLDETFDEIDFDEEW
jgi:TolA-binding protein